MEREGWKEFVSRVFNWFTGGSLKEMFCERMLREKKYSLVWTINWLYFFACRDVMHCQRITKNGNKDD